MKKVGILHPGAMGSSIAAAAAAGGHAVYWAAAGRSAASRARADAQGLIALESLAELCAVCDVLLCVCPPDAAVTVAAAVASAGFRGLYCDGNAIAPQKARLIGERLAAAGIDFVDGSIIGPPAWRAGTTRFYLSGSGADAIAALFAGSLTEAIPLGEEIGKASALKMVFAAGTKGATALTVAILGVAEQLGLRADLHAELARREADLPQRRQQQARAVTAKAWRFAGEMQEIATTFEEAGLPPGFFQAAQEVYQRLALFKYQETTPEIEAVLAALLKPD